MWSSCFASTGCSGSSHEERFGGTGTGTLLALVAVEEVSRVCATSGLILAVQELGSLGLRLAGSAEQQAALAAAARVGGGAGCVRADGGGLRVGFGGDAHDRAA